MVRPSHSSGIQKAPTGMPGFDEITAGGLPRGRMTLISGGPGCGKTLFAMQFLVQGALQFKEKGLFISFEEKSDELEKNFASFGFDLSAMQKNGQLFIDHVQMAAAETMESGRYDLEALLIRIGDAIQKTGAKRVALDTIEMLFSGFSNHAILRSELHRLFSFLKEKGVTAIITAERVNGDITEHRIEEYVSDCVILLDHRTQEQIATRRLRIVKYRGSVHGTNEYPFVIDDDGPAVLPITSMTLDYPVPKDRIPSGIPELDDMMEGKGFFRTSSVLVSGRAGTGKSTFSAHFIDAACRRGEKCLYFAFEESPHQIIRNMRSIGLDLEKWRKKGLLYFHASRPALHSLEMHLMRINTTIRKERPDIVIFDPISNFLEVGNDNEIKALWIRLIDFLKNEGITTIFTTLIFGYGETMAVDSVAGISSLMDTWMLLHDVKSGGERNLALQILKSRGMSHSRQIREYRLTQKGINLSDVYVGSGEVLMGSARIAQEARDKAEELAGLQELENRRRELERKRRAMETQIADLQDAFIAEEKELLARMKQKELLAEAKRAEQGKMQKFRASEHLSIPASLKTRIPERTPKKSSSRSR